MRFDGHRYRDCRWCHGRGCLACEAEADAAYRRAARKALGPDAMKKAFGPGGGGVEELVANLTAARSGV